MLVALSQLAQPVPHTTKVPIPSTAIPPHSMTSAPTIPIPVDALLMSTPERGGNL